MAILISTDVSILSLPALSSSLPSIKTIYFPFAIHLTDPPMSERARRWSRERRRVFIYQFLAQSPLSDDLFPRPCFFSPLLPYSLSSAFLLSLTDFWSPFVITCDRSLDSTTFFFKVHMLTCRLCDFSFAGLWVRADERALGADAILQNSGGDLKWSRPQRHRGHANPLLRR